MILLIIFIIVPLIEISLFIAVGDEIGILNTLLLCVVTAFIGAFMLRNQGLRTLLSARETMDRQELPMKELFDGLCLTVS